MPVPLIDDPLLRVALAAHLGRYRSVSRVHTESDLHVYLRWCAERDIGPLAAGRADVELYVRWLQEVRRFKPSTVSSRLSVVVGFYRNCVIDAVLDYSPAAYVRRPSVPPESPALDLSHLQFEAIITVARTTTKVFDFALVATLGLLGLRIFEACGATIGDLGAEHGHRVLWGLRQEQQGRARPAAARRRARHRPSGRRAARRLDPAEPTRSPDGSARRLKHLARTAGVRMPRMHPHRLRHTYVTTMLDAGVPLRDVQIATRHADPRTTMRYDRGPQESRPPPQLRPRRRHGLRRLNIRAGR